MFKKVLFGGNMVLQVVQCVETAYEKSSSIEHFLSQIRASGHEPYYRNGRLQGIKYEGERKFRLKNLGYDEKKLLALDGEKVRIDKALDEIGSIRNRGRDMSKSKDIEPHHRKIQDELTEPEQKAL